MEPSQKDHGCQLLIILAEEFSKKMCFKASEAYLSIAREFGIDPCQMALAFCRSRSFYGVLQSLVQTNTIQLKKTPWNRALCNSVRRFLSKN